MLTIDRQAVDMIINRYPVGGNDNRFGDRFNREMASRHVGLYLEAVMLAKAEEINAYLNAEADRIEAEESTA